MSNAKTKPLKSLRNAFEIVEYLKQAGGAGVTEVANELCLPKSTAHVYLTSLEEIGYAVNDGGTYRISLRFLDIGESVRGELNFYQQGCEEVDRLAEESGELASMMIPEHGRGVYLYRSGGGSAMPAKTHIGQHVDLHCRASGKAILAHLPREQVEWIIEERGLVQKTEHTLTEPAELWEELERIRNQGFAQNDGELREGLRCIGAPVLHEDGVVGAISISGPAGRIDDETFDNEFPELVMNVANIVEITTSYS